MVGWRHHSMKVSFSKLQELVMDRESWHATVHGVSKTQTWLSRWTELKLVEEHKSYLIQFFINANSHAPCNGKRLTVWNAYLVHRISLAYYTNAKYFLLSSLHLNYNDRRPAERLEVQYTWKSTSGCLVFAWNPLPFAYILYLHSFSHKHAVNHMT